ncbi:hypothetical protein MPSI1_003940 [Malassezia psittaci]|uniref:TauD/TfdA-like domain-containing protein n=1 Tax=Malassezia psittaci TaxID=1821823 RepID=A0AAF0F9S4_9BASI|nr:hypothetical protein MPSI1_003940 [Malassezia psittaci]
MAPAIHEQNAYSSSDLRKDSPGSILPSTASSIRPKAPLKASGMLDELYTYEELTPAIGRVYTDLQLAEVLSHTKADEILRDIAITISRRGVVFFKEQELSPDQQKYITDRLGHLTGKPASSGLHIHPVFNAERTGQDQIVDAKGTTNNDNEISVISSNIQAALSIGPRNGADEWHSDISFEPVPADYTSLKVHTLPSTGGDTLWGSGYEVYDQLSAALQKLLEKSTGVYHSPVFARSAAEKGYSFHPGPRGATENVGTSLTAEHPIVRTNPVTGWKSIFSVGQHMQQINGLTDTESNLIRKHLRDLLTQNHANQVRYRWQANDLAIWDNRSTYHAATPDYLQLGPRSGVRAVSCGERPYYDANSISRREELKGTLI